MSKKERLTWIGIVKATSIFVGILVGNFLVK